MIEYINNFFLHTLGLKHYRWFRIAYTYAEFIIGWFILPFAAVLYYVLHIIASVLLGLAETRDYVKREAVDFATLKRVVKIRADWKTKD